MENKYYTPDDSEFCVGFEYEVEDDPRIPSFEKVTIENLYDLERFCKYNKKDNDAQIRVKYLDREDIEETLGVKQLKGEDVEINFQVLIDYSNNFYEFDYELDILELTVELYKEINNDRFSCYTLFRGKIKNKSELKKLIQQLQIA